MTATFEVKKEYKIEIDETKLVKTIKEAWNDFVPPDSDSFDCLEDWALELTFEDAFDEADFIKVDGWSYTFDEIERDFYYDIADYIKNLVVNFIVKWVRENWG